MRKRLVCLLVAAAVIAGPFVSARAQSPEPLRLPSESAAQRDERMRWWREARFGMFVHWGLYAIAAGEWDGRKWTRGGMEWIQKRANVPADVYAERLVPQFKPKQGFAREWAELAAAAGCKYVVFTNKHHDGFALHDSAVSDFDAKDVTGRDLHEEIVQAVREAGLRIGCYHSLWDWHHPHAYAGAGTNNPNCQTMEGRNPEIYLQYLHQQVREIVTGYGKLDILWFDYSSPQIQGESWKANQLVAMVRQQQPDIVTNNRLYRSAAAGWHDDHHLEPFDNRYGDFCTPEQRIPPTGIPGVDWETCMTINTTWGYSKHDHAWKSSQTLIRNLVDIASKGGNYLLNIGPMADGTVPPETVTRMRDIGRWMETNGESIYGTTASPFDAPPWGRCTKKVGDSSTVLYLHVFDWPTDGKLLVPGLQRDIQSARLLAGDQSLSPRRTEDGVEIAVPDNPTDDNASVVVVEVAGVW
jgi:alpha-L-fucosidase